MINKIDKNSKILSTKDFERDKYLFSIILENLNNPSLEVYSDDENYIFCQGEEYKPVWIWNRDNVSLDVLLEIKELINNYIGNKDKIGFICKNNLYQLLKNDVIQDDDCNEIGFLICENIKKPEVCDGYVYIPNMYDMDLLSKYYYENCLESKGVNTITIDQAKLYIEKIFDKESLYDSTNIYGWKNNNNEIVSLAIYSSIGNCAKINNVFTPVGERRKGYASNLIYCITQEIINDDLMPIVYLSNNSNCNYNLYRNVGYVKSGTLINFICSKAKVKKR